MYQSKLPARSANESKRPLRPLRANGIKNAAVARKHRSGSGVEHIVTTNDCGSNAAYSRGDSRKRFQ